MVRSHLKLFSCFRLDLKLLWLDQSIEQQASSFNIFEVPTKRYFCCHCLCLSFVTEDGVTGSARRLNLLFVQQLLRRWGVVCVSRRLCFLLFFCCFHLLLLIAQLVVKFSMTSGCSDCRVGGRAGSPRSCTWGDSSYCCACHCRDCHCCGASAPCIDHAVNDDSLCRVKRMTGGSCSGWQNVTVCVRCARLVTIDAPAGIVVIAMWVLLWYSRHPHNSLVAFVGKAALWLWGWLPQSSLLHLIDSSCEHFGASQWLRWSCPLQLVMAFSAFIAIGNVVVACCCSLQLCLALMLTLHLQLRFLLVC